MKKKNRPARRIQIPDSKHTLILEAQFLRLVADLFNQIVKMTLNKISRDIQINYVLKKDINNFLISHFPFCSSRLKNGSHRIAEAYAPSAPNFSYLW